MKKFLVALGLLAYVHASEMDFPTLGMSCEELKHMESRIAIQVPTLQSSVCQKDRIWPNFVHFGKIGVLQLGFRNSNLNSFIFTSQEGLESASVGAEIARVVKQMQYHYGLPTHLMLLKNKDLNAVFSESEPRDVAEWKMNQSLIKLSATRISASYYLSLSQVLIQK